MKLFKQFLVLVIICLSFSQVNAQVKKSLKAELRGVWVAALGIDWPSTTGTELSDIATQKKELISLFDAHKTQGMNAIFFHVRPLCDALYKSPYEPWSRWLTGTQGAAPKDASWDPLTYAVDAAHKRGMELHAWLNPYRITQSGGSVDGLAANNVYFQHPDWVIKCSGSEYRFLDPGNPYVREYLLKIIMDIVRRYDVDGIHFDDYFYPYTDYGSFNDNATFEKYPNGFTNKTLWRENNVNLLCSMIRDSIKSVKPWIKFGLSPSGNPSVNTSIFCDTDGWLAGNYTDTNKVVHKGTPLIDYIMPQLYWSRYNGNLPAWNSETFLNGRHLYVGLPAYRYGLTSFPADELLWDINTNRGNALVKGSVYFSAKSLTSNLGACADSLKYSFYTHPAITPQMKWMDKAGTTKPNAPTDVKMVLNSSTGKYELHWTKPAPTAAGDTAMYYLVYRFEAIPGDIANTDNIFGLTGETYLNNSYAKYSVTRGNYYAVTAIDRYSNESDISNVFYMDTTGLAVPKVGLLLPVKGNNQQGNTVTLKWSVVSGQDRYNVQVSTDSLFNGIILKDISEYTGSSAQFKNLDAGVRYYWRVKAFSVGGSSTSETYWFESGFPVAPVLAEPAHKTTDAPLNLTFKWFKNEKATSYKFQLSLSAQFATLVKESTLSDTLLSVSGLTVGKFYYWRVYAINSFGTSDPAKAFGFKTITSTAVEEQDNIRPSKYALSQNYPNPFNPSTVINYQLPQDGRVVLKMYDILGNEISTLMDEYKSAGSHNYHLNISSLNVSSGVYFYSLRAGSYHQVKKMTVLK